MAAALSLYQTILGLSVFVTGGTAAYVWYHRDQLGAVELSIVFGTATVWAGAAFAETFTSAVGETVLLTKIIFLAVVVHTPAFLLFALTYTGRQSYVTRRTVAALAVEPILFTALAWTNSAHELVWTLTRTTEGVDFTGGLVFWLHTAYSYGLMTVAVLLIVVFAFRSRYLYQRQAAILVLAALTGWAGNAVSLVVEGYHITSISFALAALALSWAVVREDFLDITPVATETVMDTIDTAVFVVDDADRIVELNESARELLEGDDGSAVGTSVRDRFAQSPNVLAVYERLANETEQMAHETTFGDRFIRIQMSPLREHGRLVGRAFIVVDLTEQRDRRERLEQRNEQLDRFAGVVSHDLRNPLEVADGSVRLARETGDVSHLERTERAHDRMDRLIEDLLMLSRQEEAPTSVESVDLAEQAAAAWSYVDTDGARLEAGTDWQVEADRDRLSQLLENCFRNAVEHGSTSPDSQARQDAVEHGVSDEPSVADEQSSSSSRSAPPRENAVEHGDDRLTVTVDSLSDESGFYIADDGVGFEDADRDAIFGAGVTTDSGGTGFGLSIVERIASQHGWSVRATDSETGGARIEVLTDGE